MMKTQKGFTLIELMIVVVIVAVLATIAFPSYQEYILRSHRVEARNTLQTIAQQIEQHYKITRSYNTLASSVNGSTQLKNETLTAWGLNVSPKSNTVRYNITFSSGPDAGSYTLQAQAVGPQVGDKRCADFFLTQSGAKMARARGDSSAPTVNSDASRECWTK